MLMVDKDKCGRILIAMHPRMKVSRSHATHHPHTAVPSYTTLTFYTTITHHTTLKLYSSQTIVTTLTSQHIHHLTHHRHICTHTTPHQHHIDTQLIHTYVHVMLYVHVRASYIIILGFSDGSEEPSLKLLRSVKLQHTNSSPISI